MYVYATPLPFIYIIHFIISTIKKAGHVNVQLTKEPPIWKKKIITGLDTYRKYNFPKYINKEDGDNISFCI